MQYELIATISMSNETEKFKPFVEKVSEKGWKTTRLIFNAIAGDNRHSLQISGGHWNDGHGDVFSFSKSYTTEDGTQVKGEPIRIPFKERLNADKIAQVAEFRKFVIDLEEPNRRWKLKNLVDRLEEGDSITDDDLAEVNVDSVDDIVKEYKRSIERKKEFIHESDYAKFIKKVIESGKYKDRKFLIRGNSESRYSEQNETIYTNLVPTRMYLASDNEEYKSKGTIKLYFNKDSLDSTSVEETGKYYINGFERVYDNACKNNNLPVETTIVLPVGDTLQDEKKANALKKVFDIDEDGWFEYGCVVDMLNGSQRVEITMDMLTEEQRELIELEIITLDEVRKEMGGEAYGDRIVENRLKQPSTGYSKGRKETSFEDEDFVIHLKSEDVEDVTEDLFEDDDDLI